MKKIILSALAMLAMVWSLLPIMSGTVTDGEAARLTVRGIGLVSISPISAVTLIAPIIFIIVLLGNMTVYAKELTLIGVIILSCVGFAFGFIEAREWLVDICGVGIEYSPFGLMYPFVLPILTLFFHLWKNGEKE